MHIDFSKLPLRVNKHFYSLIFDNHRIIVLVGGASSSKSYSTGQKIINRCIEEKNHKYLVVRKVAKTLRHSTFDLLLAILSDWGMRDLFKVNQTDLQLTCIANGNEIIFTGLDDVEKLKSIHGITDIWIEEASELIEAEFNQLDLRLRGETKYKKQITLTLNPISINHWIKKRFFDRSENDCITHRSTYKDNTHLDKDTIIRLEQITDPYFKSVYVLGEWGVYGNVVFSNYEIIDFDYTENDLENIFNGMDFGYNHAQVIERAGFRIDHNDSTKEALYVFDELYEKERINSDYIDDAKSYFGDNLYSMLITADCAYPAYIEEWNQNNFRVEAAKKGKDSIQFGVQYLTGIKIYIHRTKCSNLAREIPMYKRRVDKDDNVIEGEYVKLNDDTIDALRYGCEFIWNNRNSVYYDPGYGLSDLGL